MFWLCFCVFFFPGQNATQGTANNEGCHRFNTFMNSFFICTTLCICKMYNDFQIYLKCCCHCFTIALWELSNWIFAEILLLQIQMAGKAINKIIKLKLWIVELTYIMHTDRNTPTELVWVLGTLFVKDLHRCNLFIQYICSSFCATVALQCCEQPPASHGKWRQWLGVWFSRSCLHLVNLLPFHWEEVVGTFRLKLY